MTLPGPLNAMTVDVEDWYQVSAFEGVLDRARWDALESRVEANTRRVMDVLARHDVRGTFFTLGWVAQRHPSLLRELRDRGHEIASHGFEHRLLTSFSKETFRDDLRRAADAIHAACAVRVTGFRAPSFSVGLGNLWVHDVLREEGYAFSSSVFPVRHDRYGIPDFPRHPVVLAGADGRTIWEVPMTTRRVWGRNLPVAGGGWMRLLPGAVMRRALRTEMARGGPTIVYLHPWELDPGQPKVPEAPWKARVRHRLNLDRTEGRLDRLLAEFRYGTVSEMLATLDPATSGARWTPPVPAGLS
jgi:polysaccharide deacetylase family protein (PEP-CTERM system associated)